MSSLIDRKIKDDGLTGAYIAEENDINGEFMNLKRHGEVEGFDDSKKRMVIRSVLLLEKKVSLVISTNCFILYSFSEIVQKR
jgi:hypothetical protein